jgi:hypothetical protein
MVDALDSKSGVSNGVRVRVSSPVKRPNFGKVQMSNSDALFLYPKYTSPVLGPKKCKFFPNLGPKKCKKARSRCEAWL